MARDRPYFIIGQHRLGPPIAVALMVVLASCYLLFGADPEKVPIVFRAARVPAGCAGLLISVWLTFCLIRARGRVLVGGLGWIAEYRYMNLRPLKDWAEVDEASRLKLRVKHSARPPYDRQLKGWIELVVVDHRERELVWTVANPKWLNDDYEKRFERWREANASS